MVATASISQLTAASAANLTDLIEATQGSSGPGTGTGRSLTLAQVIALVTTTPPLVLPLPIAQGGTGQITAPLARVALDQGLTILTDAAHIATDCSQNNVFAVTLGADRILDNPTNMVAGATYIWIIFGATHALTYGSQFLFPSPNSNASPPALSGNSNVLSAVYGGINLYCNLSAAFS